eukprot:gene33809-41707_t
MTVESELSEDIVVPVFERPLPLARNQSMGENAFTIALLLLKQEDQYGFNMWEEDVMSAQDLEQVEVLLSTGCLKNDAQRMVFEDKYPPRAEACGVSPRQSHAAALTQPAFRPPNQQQQIPEAPERYVRQVTPLVSPDFPVREMSGYQKPVEDFIVPINSGKMEAQSPQPGRRMIPTHNQHDEHSRPLSAYYTQQPSARQVSREPSPSPASRRNSFRLNGSSPGPPDFRVLMPTSHRSESPSLSIYRAPSPLFGSSQYNHAHQSGYYAPPITAAKKRPSIGAAQEQIIADIELRNQQQRESEEQNKMFILREMQKEEEGKRLTDWEHQQQQAQRDREVYGQQHMSSRLAWHREQQANKNRMILEPQVQEARNKVQWEQQRRGSISSSTGSFSDSSSVGSSTFTSPESQYRPLALPTTGGRQAWDTLQGQESYIYQSPERYQQNTVFGGEIQCCHSSPH